MAIGWRQLGLATALRIGAAILQGLYVLVRLGQVTVTSKAVVFSPLSLVATFALSTCGALIYFRARSRLGRAAALLVMTFVGWSPIVFGLVVLAAFDMLAFGPRYGAALYNYSLGLLPLSSFVLTWALSGLVVRLVSSKKRSRAG